MAQKHITELVDDIDGTTAVETITFAIDGKTYVIDLNTDNATQLRNTFTTYTEAGRKATVAGASTATKPASSKRTDLADIRTWANQNGYTVADRGRIATNIQNAYDATH